MIRLAMRPMPLVAAATVAVDRVTKWAVVEALDLMHRQTIEIWPGVVSFRMAWNRGVNFGLFASDSETARFALAGLAVAVSVGVALWAGGRRDPFIGVAAGLLIGGALGNAWDRMRYGAVADFLNVTCCGVVNPYAFNVADVAIFAGAIGLAFAPAGRPTAPRP